LHTRHRNVRAVHQRATLKNVYPRTVAWYREAFKWLVKFPLTEAGLKEFVIAMRQSGLRSVSCNGRTINM
jgi:hypothetical protein